MPAFKKCFNIKAKDFIHAGEASIAVQNMLKQLNVASSLIRRIAICGYEGEMNIVMHGGDGSFCVEIDTDRILLDLSDDGPGIADIEKAKEKGFSTASDEYREMGFGAGMGLSNMEKNADQMTIESEPGKGTQVQMVFETGDSEQNRGGA
ncbi:MAG: ATP-binding protein [Desulfobacterales bacterium]